MRHSPIAGGTLRLVVEEAELGGYIFPAGTMVLVNTAAGNRITREGAPPILTFGGGVHYCLGANLARREIAETLNVVTARLDAGADRYAATSSPLISPCEHMCLDRQDDPAAWIRAGGPLSDAAVQ
jgi:cytochrome P450